jgi:hypothetical protein
MGRLFAASFSDVSRGWQKSVADYVDALPRPAFERSDFDELLRREIEKRGFEVAKLQPEKRHGKRRDVQRTRSDYGREVTKTHSVLDVYIPFTGSSESFQLAPSSCIIIHAEFDIKGRELVLTVPDDASADAAVNSLIHGISQNLDTLRKEVDQAQVHLPQIAATGVQARRAQIARERARDSALSFPVS